MCTTLSFSSIVATPYYFRIVAATHPYYFRIVAATPYFSGIAANLWTRRTCFSGTKPRDLSLQGGFSPIYLSWDKTEVVMSKFKRRSYHAGAEKKAGGGKHVQESSIFNKKQNPQCEELWSKEKVEEGLRSSTLFQGSLTISNNKFEYAFVTNPTGGPDFFLDTTQARNRALQDDIVVVQPLEDQTPLPSSSGARDGGIPDVSSLSIADGSSSESATPTSKNATPTSSVATPAVATATTSEVTSSPMETLVDRLYSDSGRKTKQTDHVEKQRKAKVVYIMKKVHNRTCVGNIKAFDKKKGMALLGPRDHRLPRILIPLEELPEDLGTFFKKYESTFFVCNIQDWDPSSPFPTGHMTRSLGEAGLVESESETILIDQQIDYSEFTKDVEDCLPDTPWTIPKA